MLASFRTNLSVCLFKLCTKKKTAKFVSQLVLNDTLANLPSYVACRLHIIKSSSNVHALARKILARFLTNVASGI